MIAVGRRRRRGVRCAAAGILLGVGAAVSAGAMAGQGIPPTLGWHELANTKLRAVCPPNGFSGSDYDFADACGVIPDAWNSGVMDTRRNRLIVWGGGHNDYLGNELYALDVGSLKVERLTDPGLPLPRADSDCPEALGDGTQPNSRHTYDGIAYIEHADRLFAFGGSLSRCGGSRQATWTFDFASGKWERRNHSGTVPNPDYGIVSAYDPKTRKVFLHDSSSFYAYTFETDRYERLATNSPIDYHMTAVIDPVRRKFVVVGAGSVHVYDLDARHFFRSRQTITTNGGDPIVRSLYPGLAYDPITASVVAWNGGDTVYRLDLDSATWVAVPYPGGPGPAAQHGTFKRWSYSPASGVFVVINSMDRNAYAFRLTPSNSPR